MPILWQKGRRMKNISDILSQGRQARLEAIEKHLADDLHLIKCPACQKWEVKENFPAGKSNCETCEKTEVKV